MGRLHHARRRRRGQNASVGTDAVTIGRSAAAPSRIRRVGPAVAWTCGAIVAAIFVATLLVSGAPAPWDSVLKGLALLPLCVLIAAGRPEIAVGWLAFGVSGMFALQGLCAEAIEHGPGTLAPWAVLYLDRASALIVPVSWLALMLLPDGRLPSRRWRPVVVGVLVLQVALISAWCVLEGSAAAPDSTYRVAGENPIGVFPETWTGALDSAAFPILVGPQLLLLWAIVVRVRRAVGDERRRLVSMLGAVVLFVLALFLSDAAEGYSRVASDGLDVVGAIVLGAGLTAAVLRRRMHEVDVVIHHGLVYGVLTLTIAGVYVGLMAVLGALGEDLPPFGIGLVAGIVALVLLPLRGVLQRLLGRALYGDVRDPRAAVRRLTASVTEATTLDAVVDGLARATRTSLRAAAVTVEVQGRVAQTGTPGTGERIALPLRAGDDSVGTLQVVFPTARRVQRQERELLDELADHGGRAVHAVLMAEALLANRQLLVSAREEERSRLRRDLHDELGPTLAGLAMQLNGLQEVLASDPAAVAERLGRLEAATRDALDDVRRLSRDLRPPSLDELGLVGALERVAHDAGLALTVEGDRRVGGAVPAAVEVAAYRIGAEALVNVARHAGVGTASLRVARDDVALRLEVADEGTGTGRAPAGVGTLAMRERAQELGGRLSIHDRSGGGTIVAVWLPATRAGGESGRETA
jgi:signal transduction histidine kinase